MQRGLIWAGLVLSLAAAGGAMWKYATTWTPSRTTYAVQGIDVAEGNGAIDWAMVKARDVDFAYAQATRGAEARDTRFAANWAGIAEAGIRRGAIHVFSLCNAASVQAGAFVATVPRDPGALPAVIDLSFDEACPARPARDVVIEEIRRVAAVIETHSGKPAILRIAPEFEAQYQVSGAITRPLWASRFFLAPDYFARPWAMWQSSTIRRIDGVEGPVNWNVVAP
ncbi:GH25 family lysozyme [Sphingomonas sp. BT-65]|uniref:GH25 family lysozyme n=1 Tax=Sphingomonas sp. BT-65 TaxID=2989821 RepID=UPI0022363A85|nr:GH25 family lysozyme [Sphingomonas sp. BT-65]MCW4463303.1 GH25 family lysozyme [Sphingomonas sp. BT-65]